MADFIKSGGQADWMKKGKQHQKMTFKDDALIRLLNKQPV
jgi:hypothetical protein